MIVDWNAGEVKKGQVFHFQNSLRPFVYVQDTHGEDFFLDLDTMKFYHFDELEFEGLFFYFYDIEDGEDRLGVEIDGHLDWVE